MIDWGDIYMSNLILDYIQVLTPMIVGALSLYVAKINRDNQKVREANERTEQLEKEKRQTERDNIEKRFGEIESSLKEIKKEQRVLDDRLSNNDRLTSSVWNKLDRILVLNEISMQYYQSMSNVIIAISDTDNMDASLAAAIEKHRERENEIMNKIVKSTYQFDEGRQ